MVRSPQSVFYTDRLLILLLFTWWCQSIGCVLIRLFFPGFSTNGVPNKKRNLLKCPHNAKGPAVQFTPWFETRCTVDIDRFYNFRYPLCMGKLSYLKQKDDTPLITNSTAEDDETMNGRKAGWTKGSSSNVNSTLGYGDECSMISVTSQNLSQYPVTCSPCLSRRGNATGTKWSWYQGG